MVEYSLYTVGCSVTKSCSTLSVKSTPWTAALQTSLSFTVSQSLLKLMSIEPVILLSSRDHNCIKDLFLQYSKSTVFPNADSEKVENKI